MDTLHVMYEVLAKEVAYAFDKPEYSATVNAVLYAAGYHPVDLTQPNDQEFKIFNDPTTGFQALGLIPRNLEKQSPVLIIRGIDEAIDDLSGIDPRGVGFKQFEANQAAIAQWLETFAGATKPDLIGHSLGGGVAQLVAAEFTDQIGQVITFNSPGTSRAAAAQFVENGGTSNRITHYVVNGDLVSLGGEAFLTGKVILQSFTDPAINPIYALDKHRNVGLLLGDHPPVGYTQSELSVEELNRPTFLFKDADYNEFLAAYAAVAPEKAVFLTSRAGAETLRTLPGSSYLGLLLGARDALDPAKNNTLIGNEQDNTANGAEGNDIIVGNGGNDSLHGGTGYDAISGNGGDDQLIGDAGSDALVGGFGDDLLIGIDPGAPGLREIDALTGNSGADTFVLGNKRTTFYDDGQKTTVGRLDFALITDFGRSDAIQLHGKASDYILKREPVQVSIGTAIYLNTEGKDELISLVAGATNLNLNSNSFTFA